MPEFLWVILFWVAIAAIFIAIGHYWSRGGKW